MRGSPHAGRKCPCLNHPDALPRYWPRRSAAKEWENSYESIKGEKDGEWYPAVVPRSGVCVARRGDEGVKGIRPPPRSLTPARCRRIMEDGEGFYLYTVLVLRNFLSQFKHHCKEKRCAGPRCRPPKRPVQVLTGRNSRSRRAMVREFVAKPTEEEESGPSDADRRSSLEVEENKLRVCSPSPPPRPRGTCALTTGSRFPENHCCLVPHPLRRGVLLVDAHQGSARVHGVSAPLRAARQLCGDDGQGAPAARFALHSRAAAGLTSPGPPRAQSTKKQEKKVRQSLSSAYDHLVNANLRKKETPEEQMAAGAAGAGGEFYPYVSIPIENVAS